MTTCNPMTAKGRHLSFACWRQKCGSGVVGRKWGIRVSILVTVRVTVELSKMTLHSMHAHAT